MVRRAQHHAAYAALRDEGVLALGWLGRGAVGLVKGGEVLLEHVGDGLVLGQPERVIERADKQRLDGLALGVLLGAEDHGMSLRLLQDHLGDVEQRIRPARHLDLARQGFDPLLFRAEAQINFRQW